MKENLREKIKKERNSLFMSGELNVLSKKITKNIIESSDFKNAQNIALYYPKKTEIDLTSILNIKGKNFYLPRTRGLDMEFVKYSGELQKSSFGIYEPKGQSIDPRILDLIYIPALCANKYCYRLGWGMGYYDRFFSKNKIKAKKIIIVASCFVLDEFKEEKSDYKCDFLLTEK